MTDGGVLVWVRASGARKRAGMRGPRFRAQFRWIVRRTKLVLWWWPDGVIRPVARFRWNSSGHFEPDAEPLWRKPKMRRVAAAAPDALPRHLASLVPGGLDKLPGVIDHLAVTKYDDGTARKVGAIRITTEGPEWSIRVSDPDSLCSFVARAETLWDALLMVELLLTSDRCPWSPDSFLAEQAAKKKKK